MVLLGHGDFPARLLLGQLLLEPVAEHGTEEPSLRVRVIREEDRLSLANSGKHLVLVVSFLLLARLTWLISPVSRRSASTPRSTEPPEPAQTAIDLIGFSVAGLAIWTVG